MQGLVLSSESKANTNLFNQSHSLFRKIMLLHAFLCGFIQPNNDISPSW